jgi:hypothetical protein
VTRPHRSRSVALAVTLALVATLGVLGVGAGSSVPAPAAQDGGQLPPGGTFRDDDGNLHEGMIEAIVAEGITGGCTPDGDRYCPASAVSRGQMATFLARALGLPAATRDHFPDDAGSTHEDSINRVADAGIATGSADGRYHPGRSVTRAQMASFLARALALPPAGDPPFTDVVGTHAGAIARVAEAGITRGCDASGTRYCPDNPVARDQMASFLGRGLGLSPRTAPPRALNEGIGVAMRWMDAIATLDLADAQAISSGPARAYAEHLTRLRPHAEDDLTTRYEVVSPNRTATALGDRLWRLDAVLRWEVADEPLEARDLVVRQRPDGSFTMESLVRAGAALGAHVRTGTIARTTAPGLHVTLVSQFRRVDRPSPDLVVFVSVTNLGSRVVYIDDTAASFTAGGTTTHADMNRFPAVPPGQTLEVPLVFDRVATSDQAGRIALIAFGPDGGDGQQEQAVTLDVPAWPRT